MVQIDFTNPKLNEIVRGKLETILPSWEKEVWSLAQQLLNPSITTFRIFTSGSTGKPKAITHSRQTLFSSAQMTCDALGLKPGNSALLCLPVNGIGGMMMVVRCYINKMVLYCIQPSANPFLAIGYDSNIDFAAFTPMQFGNITSNAGFFKRAETISNILLGGQDVSRELQNKVEKMNNHVFATFGMTETVSHIALKKLSGENPYKYYKALPGIEIDADERNCLIIKAPQLNQPHLITSDIIKKISDTEFEWLGRFDNVINTGGIKLYPEVIEQQLQPHIPISFFIAGLQHEKTGEKPVIVIEKEKLSDAEIHTIKTSLNILDKISRPVEILLIPRFLRTETGKLLRAESLKHSIQTLRVEKKSPR
jgi:o-succinylbenzoate---CoA ligase